MIDVHAHYEDPRFDGDRAEALAAARAAGVEFIVNCGSSLESSEAGIRLAAEHDFVYSCVGIHPHHADDLPPGAMERVEATLGRPKVVAVGETGLDYHYDNSDREAQKRLFKAHLDLAMRRGLPAVIHNREAHADIMDIIRPLAGKLNAMLHCYSGSAQMAAELVKMGYYFSFGGILTFTNARVCREAAAAIPLERIMLETDCPYLSPHPLRGQRNDSSRLPLVLAALAQIKGVSLEEAERVTSANARRFFGL